MPLSRAEAALRPRTPWEAVDLGVRYPRRRRQLMKEWRELEPAVPSGEIAAPKPA